MFRLRRATAALVLVSLLGACGQDFRTDVMTPVSDTTVHAAADRLLGPPVLLDPTTVLYVAFDGDSSDVPQSTHVVNLADGTDRTLKFTSDHCPDAFLAWVSGFADGEPVGVAECGDMDTRALVRIDPLGSRLTVLAELPPLLAFSPPSRGNTGVLVSRDPGQWTATCRALKVFTAGNWAQVGPLTPVGALTWDADRLLGGEGFCQPHDNVLGIAATGTKVYVVATQNQQTCRPWDTPHDGSGSGCGVYEVDLAAQTIRQLADGFDGFTEISAAGPYGAVMSAVRDGQSGLWLVGGHDHTVTLLESGVFSGPSVTPSGDVVAAVGSDDEECRIVKIKLP
ncbi:hypothetical protein Cs7R123_20130 [Catellatospora sp. TT07R-123]|uniref:hypothetical protein n=1 Tax=Catellatospora sp. TT07R-123 TaxID=2733863 RepID=UPI001AFF141B|nr:hypothetical protein [Catellatospora sp. TT07R-123]GHJ44671.1 hypothetical protein Cs7R123_20130 [Catellatospora sp. TT07R-123]